MTEDFQRYVRGDGDCMTWTGKRNAYGVAVWPTPRSERQYWIGLEPLAVEWVAAWQLGLDHPDELPANHTVVTTCGNRLCVSGDHVTIVTAAVESTETSDNVGTAPASRKRVAEGTVRTRSTECERGHSYAEHGKLSADGYWRCLVCRRAAVKNVPRSERVASRSRPCRNGHDVEEKRTSYTNGKPWTYCAACRREATRKRNAERRKTPECLNGHDRSVHGYRDSVGAQRCRACERERKRKR